LRTAGGAIGERCGQRPKGRLASRERPNGLPRVSRFGCLGGERRRVGEGDGVVACGSTGFEFEGLKN
jgi:hypothetical protein